MTTRIFILESAERDLKDLRRYFLANFSDKQWQDTYAGIKDAIRGLRKFPHSGAVPEEITQLGLTQYRQILSGKTDIIYEIGVHEIYIHIIADMRRDMGSHLSKRLLEREP
jgi:Plasmid stabilisation system protein.